MRDEGGQLCYNSIVPTTAVFGLVPFNCLLLPRRSTINLIFEISLHSFCSDMNVLALLRPLLLPSSYKKSKFVQAYQCTNLYNRNKPIIRSNDIRPRNGSAPGGQCDRNKQIPF